MATKKTIVWAATGCLLLQTLAVVLTAPALATSPGGPPSGAIFTTDENGTRVNQNIYDDKRDVYIDGGPGPNAPQTAAGLDDGNYYFQVTGTDGKALFSSDPVKCREFRVHDGIIVEYLGKNRTWAVPGGYRFCSLDGKQNGRHDTGTDQDHNAVTIQLMPYNNTSNPGGVYKVWVTATADFEGNASLIDNPSGAGQEHGFYHSKSKTDNFKVRASETPSFTAPTLTVRKFNDFDGDGVWDQGEAEIGVDQKVSGGGWPVAVVDEKGAVSTGFTSYLYYPGFKGNYTTVEATQDSWTQTALIVDGTAKTTLNTSAKVFVNYSSGEKHTVVYGNFKSFVVSGSKVKDANGNGVADSGESTLANWGIQLYRDGSLYASTTTGSDGKYSFTVNKGGSYVVKEIQQNGWTQTGAKDYSFVGRSGTDHTGLVFTNIQNSTQTSPSCILLCIHLTLPVSVSVDLAVDVSADLGAGTSGCPTVTNLVSVQASVEADASTGTSSNCGCDSSTTLDVDIDVTADASVNTGCTSSCGTCDTGCGDTSTGGGSCTTSCGDTSACDTGCSDTSADVNVDVNVDVGVDVGGGCTSSCGGSSSGGSSGGCTSSCGGSTDTGGCTSGCSDTGADVGADVSVDVGADVGAGSCGCDGVEVGADVGADVGLDIGL